MLDKLKFNNLIISSAKDIQKARVQTVRKIINRMRKLKSLLDKKPDNESNIIKLRKCVAITECVKKIKRMEMISTILVLEKTPDKIMTNSRSTPAEVAVAMLASNKIMQTLTSKFRQELCLKDADFVELKRNINEINKIKAKKERRKKRKAHLQSQGNAENGTKKSKKEKSKGKAKVIQSSEEKTAKVKISETESDINEGQSEEESENDKTEIQNIEHGTKNNKKQVKDNPVPKKPREESYKNDVETKFEENITDDEIHEEFESKNRHNRVKRDIPKPKVTYSVDPFFMTATGENYISHFTEIEKTEPETVSTNESNITTKPTQFFKRKETNSKPSWEKDFNLHPSWAAKQKQRAVPAGQGKKIVFGDTEAEPPVVKRVKNEAQIAQELHPSWAAKQKLKPVIASFQGKKITFGDDE